MEKKEAKKYRLLYEELRAESEDKIDSYIRYLSGGALVLSLTFISDIIPENGRCHLWIIILAWSILTLSLVLNFISYFFTIHNATKSIDDIDDEKEEWADSAKSRNKMITRFNGASAIMCIVGIIGIIIFVSININ